MASPKVKSQRNPSMVVSYKIPYDYWLRLCGTADSEGFTVSGLSSAIVKFILDRGLSADEFSLVISKNRPVIRRRLEFQKKAKIVSGGVA